MSIWRKFGEYLYIGMFFFFLSVLFGDFELVHDIQNTSDKLNFSASCHVLYQSYV